MAILAHAPVPPECRLDVADTQRLTAPVTHPAWCSQDDCSQPTGEMFHTLTAAEFDFVDADMLAVTPVSVDIWIEQIDAGAPQVQLVTTPLGQGTFRAGMTPQQALQLATDLARAARLAGA